MGYDNAMRVTVGRGTYVLAVSGGVDSMVLLDILHRKPGVNLIVAHFDHGIRKDSAQDRKLVQQTAKRLGLQFVYHAAKLGPDTSEATAREARYKFLHDVRASARAKAIITAHHQDDVLETAIMNLLRGSGRRGLTSLRSTDGIVRPLLEHSKERIKDHAISFSIPWREDATNRDTKYKRNYIRAHIMPKLTSGQRAQLLILLEDLTSINDELDSVIAGWLHQQPATNILDRKWFIGLPHNLSREITHAWIRSHGVKNITKKAIERLVTAMKTGKAGQSADIDDQYHIKIERDQLVLVNRTYAKLAHSQTD